MSPRFEGKSFGAQAEVSAPPPLPSCVQTRSRLAFRLYTQGVSCLSMMEVFVKIVILDLDFYIDGIVLYLMDTIE